jgi:hypothetical protein
MSRVHNSLLSPLQGRGGEGGSPASRRASMPSLADGPDVDGRDKPGHHEDKPAGPFGVPV